MQLPMLFSIVILKKNLMLFFHRCRMEMLECFRQATLVAPLLTFTYMQEWLTMRIQKSLSEGISDTYCTMQSPAYIEWEALTQVLDSVLSRIVMCTERPTVASGLHLLDLSLALDLKDPLILSTLLSSISALFVFLSMCPPETTTIYLPRVLEKIFAALVFTLPGETKESRSRTVKNVRRHAASLMVKIGQKYPLILLPVFDWIHAIINNLESKLSKMESICLQESLLLISNHFCEYERESAFVGEVLRPVASQWLVISNQAFNNTQQFMAFIGLDKPPVEPSSDDINGKNRSQIMNCVHLLTAVVKRCAWPDDPDRAMRGGFVVGRTDAGHPIYRNPATPHLLPLLPGLLSLMKVFNALWTPEAMAALSEGYSNAHGLCEAELNNFFLRNNSIPDQLDLNKPPHTPLYRMQQFLTYVHDSCYHIIGHAFPSLGRDLHELPGLANSLILTILSNIEYIPDYRLRPMVRVFFKGFVVSCPANCYDSVVVPVLAHFTPCMLQRLSTKWQHIAEQRENGNLDEENTDSQEVLEDMLNRILLREYLDVIKLALFGGSPLELSNTLCSMEEDFQDTKTNTSEVISELGLRLLHCDPSCQAITLTLLSALYWGDSTGSMKAYSLVTPVLRQLVQDNKMTAQLAVHAMTCVLQGLQQHGQHDGNQGSLLLLGTQLYDMLRPAYPELLDLLKKIPEVNHLDLQKLDERVLKEAQKGKVEKAKRDMFKKITTPLHGCNVSQLFRRKVFIRDLPRIDASKRTKNSSLLDNVSFHEESSFINMFKNT
uniref:Exportin-5 C-terminal domain-containing protein n=1 Tax=Clastoptera arizonana TaxID=38151 RepID=A0A1B6E001_9HEMI